MVEKKITEWRPTGCGSRVGDIVEVDGKRKLKVKCRKCSKREGRDVFHYLDLGFSN